MGTNYYLFKRPTKEEKEQIIEHIESDQYEEAIDLFPEEIHLGKSSGGWEFCFDHNNWRYWDSDSITKMKEFISKHTIIDEYDRELPHKEFWELVELKKGGLNHKRYMEQWHEIHPNLSKPYYANEEMDIYVDGYRFSSRSDFS